MYTPTMFHEPHEVKRPVDSDLYLRGFSRHGRMLTNLTLSIGSLILKCNFEVDRIGDGLPGTGGERGHAVLRRALRRLVQLVTPADPQIQHAVRRSAPFRGRESTDSELPGETSLHGPPTVAFWAALDPTERDAFRSVAVSRTFAAGARLITEGDPANYVIVILSGRTRICMDENGAVRVLAERGPGQLVGERGALQISVRSASVIAVETVRALVVRTGDFAAFISAHPRVLGLVESQVHDRLAEDRAGRMAVGSPDTFHGITAGEVAAAGIPSSSVPVGHPAQQVLVGENCTIILSDVVGFGARTRNDEDRRMIREALFSMTQAALQDLPDIWSWDDRGDGLLTVVPPTVPTVTVIEQLHQRLPGALAEHNRIHRGSAQIQLRVAVNVGPVVSDTMGLAGEAIIITARLVDAPLFKEAMDVSGASLGVITSTFIYETVIRHAPEPLAYSQIRVEVKESTLSAWVRLFGPAGTSEPGPAVAR